METETPKDATKAVRDKLKAAAEDDSTQRDTRYTPICVTKRGKLKAKYIPAMYLDSSVVIDYWLAEGSEFETPSEDDMLSWVARQNERSYLPVLRKLLKADERASKVTEIRRKISLGTKVTPVVSPLALLELMEWQAEAAIKAMMIDATSPLVIQRKSKKDIGNYLKKLLELRKREIVDSKGKMKEYSTALETIAGETWLNRGFVHSHGLWGLFQADVVNFGMTFDDVWQEASAYAYLQLGGSDIMHILLARHLGCTYFATFDDDFQRAADVIREGTGIEVLPTPESILGVL